MHIHQSREESKSSDSEEEADLAFFGNWTHQRQQNEARAFNQLVRQLMLR